MNTTTPAATPLASKPCCTPGCCDGTSARAQTTATPPPPATTAESIRDTVREGYSAIAQSGVWTKSPAPTANPCGTPPTTAIGGGCCGPTTLNVGQLATAIGYSTADLAASPDSANMGLSCGNPTAIASLKPGEVVLDLGAGGGFDCFVAGPKVGPTGRVIGVDMTPDMLKLARKGLAFYQKETSLTNVEFRLGEIEHLPVPDASVDVVISNCVLNLSPDKVQVWREIARVLKPGGRAAISDLALLRPLPESVKSDLEALVGCIAGAVLVSETIALATAAGLRDLVATPKPQYVQALVNSADPLYLRVAAALPPGTTVADFVTSLDLSARKAP